MAKIIGRASLKRKLTILPDEIKKAIRPVLEKGADQITSTMIHLAPVRSGALKNSIDWCYGLPPEGAVLKSGNKAPRNRTDLVISIYAGNERAFYARWVEFGTRGSSGHRATRAQPFFYPSYRANRKKVVSSISRAVHNASVKVAKSGGPD